VLHVAAPRDKGSEDHLTPNRLFGATQEITMIIAIIFLPVLCMVAVDCAMRLTKPH
jgi:hypothetical protein